MPQCVRVLVVKHYNLSFMGEAHKVEGESRSLTSLCLLWHVYLIKVSAAMTFTIFVRFPIVKYFKR